MKKRFLLVLVLVICLGVFLAPKVMTPAIAEEGVRVPAVIDNQPVNLDGRIYRPAGKGPYPLVVITHGRGEPADNAKVAPEDYRTAATAMAKKNFAVLSLVRRGYGKSEGKDAEGYDPKYIDVYRVGLEGAKDIQAAVAYMKTKAYIDGTKILLMGHSTGGCAVLAATSLGIPGVVGAVNFAGGMAHWDSKGRHIDSDAGLIAAFRRFGAENLLPTLWLYTRNDTFFNLSLQTVLFQTYSRNGGKATYVPLEPFANNGHFFVYREEAVGLWMPQVDKYLKTIGLDDHVNFF